LEVEVLVDKTQLVIMVKEVLIQFYQQLHLQVVEVEVLNLMDQEVQVVVDTVDLLQVQMETLLQYLLLKETLAVMELA
tara:strand:- start:179 stop:412 length:234 start_codon:yes stop_codon:yes gene_type:complete